MRILIIEDDPIISETVDICFSLRWPEAEVVLTDTGEEGLKLATAQPPDVIILDVGLPGMDGFQTLRRLRGITEAPVIMLTARDGVGCRRLHHQAVQPHRADRPGKGGTPSNRSHIAGAVTGHLLE